ncbi:MAG: microcin ABC transporter permease [Spirochaetes bacterium]|nr:MAG: microcin ABC transporter permease [Spirochaetota bacterium]
MINYIIRRILLIFPTLFGIMIINFFIIQSAPGGPVERMIAQLRGAGINPTQMVTKGGGEGGSTQAKGGSKLYTKYKGAEGLDPELIKEVEKMYGFDKPPLKRFFIMMGNYVRFDFGKSFFKDEKVMNLVKQRLPVSITLGLWTTFLVYLISIPLGIKKAVKDGSAFDTWTSFIVTVGYAIPGFLFAILLIVLFAGGSYLKIFPLRGLVSENWRMFPWYKKILDYLWHIVLPITASVIGGFASLTMFTKNSFLDEINKQYVLTARAKGLTEKKILIKHVFRNAMLIVIAGFPQAFISSLFTGTVIIEVIFSLNGLGLLGFEAALNRDYPVMFGTLYFFSMLGLFLNLLGDIMYMIIDPRIDFESRKV